MSVGFAVRRSHPVATRGGALAAAAVLAGAGLAGVATGGPEFAGAAAVTQAYHNVVPTAFPTFAESLQTLLNDFGMGDVNAVLGGFGTFTVDSTVASFLASLNPDGLTLNGVTNLFGVSLTEPLYSSTVDSLLGQGSMFLVDGVPIGNVDLGELIDVVLGDGAGAHSLTDLANAVGLGSILSQYGGIINALGLDNMNVEYCLGLLSGCGTPILNPISHPDLTLNSSLVDWLSAIVGVPTTDVTRHALSGLGSTTTLANSAWTLGELLHILPVSDTNSTTMDDATLGLLFGLPPNQTWDEYVSNLPFGGTLLDPSGVIWGDQTLGTLLSSFLPDDSTLVIDGDTPITEILEAFGLLGW